ncbi:MAG: FliM/FliN family flagellar motor switch protein [Acidobacteria bacterium]|nr:FliM/FliN family flagellar motor switch protein [Acidobacteriota bacterium]
MAVAARLASYRRAELPLRNWFAAAFPAAPQWELWLSDVAAALLQRPGRLRVRLERSNLTDPKAKPDGVRFEEELLTFGRDESNKVVLPEPAITRHHARLYREGARLMLEDLDSALGTLVNQRRMVATGRSELTDGDEFVIFPHRFLVRLEREWLPESEVHLGEAFEWPAASLDFHSSIPAGWSLFPLTIEPVGAVLSLVVADAFLEELCTRALAPPGPRPAGLTPGREAIIELLLLTALERANRDLALPFQLSLGRRGTPPIDPSEGLAVGATLNLGDLRGAFRLFLPWPALARMQAAYAGPKPTVPPDLAYSLRLSAGTVELSAAERASLEIGDVILYHPAPAVLFLDRDDQGWQASTPTPNQYKLAQRISMESPTLLDELPLRLHLIIDEKELTWAEVSRLVPGSILDLDRDPRDPVKLAVNGRVLGTGELVEIEGRLGVKLLTWGNS